jgi:hypothetical protein
MKTKMTKKEYIDFYSTITGHTKSFVERNLTEHGVNGSFQFNAGIQRFLAWVKGDRIYCQHFFHGDCQVAWYFTREGFGVDWNLIDREREEYVKQIIRDYC